MLPETWIQKAFLPFDPLILLQQIQTYRNRVLGQIYDRFDIFLYLNPVDFTIPEKHKETSTTIRKRVERAQWQQFKNMGNNFIMQMFIWNVKGNLSVNTHTQKILAQVAAKQLWSNRVQIKAIRIACSIYDLSGEANITDESIWKTIQ